jgi:twitching motility protein PilT
MHANIHRIGSRIDGLLAALWQAGGTDLLLSVGLPPMLRVDGTLTPAPGTSALSAEDTNALLAEVLTPEQGDAWASRHEYDFSFSWRDNARIRGNAFTQRGLTAVALRMIPRSIPSPDDLGLPPVLRDLALRHQGLVR